MRILVVILSLFLFQDGDRMIKGIVTFENDPMPGCIVTVVETRASRMCDNDGAYMFYLPVNTKKVTLEVSFPAGAITRVENIMLTTSETNVPRIPFFFNTSITSDQYNALSDQDKKDYVANYHWNTLIGYMSKTKIDTSTVVVYCMKEPKKIPYQYIKKLNKVVLDFQDLPDCN